MLKNFAMALTAGVVLALVLSLVGCPVVLALAAGGSVGTAIVNAYDDAE